MQTTAPRNEPTDYIYEVVVRIYPDSGDVVAFVSTEAGEIGRPIGPRLVDHDIALKIGRAIITDARRWHRKWGQCFQRT